MAKKKVEDSYNTNLASEYLMMSLLSRMGKDAYLSLGNKKGVDIIVKTNKGAICILEAKGTNGYTCPIGNNGSMPAAPNLFYALVCYNNKIEDIKIAPDFWLIHSSELNKTTEYSVATNKKTVYVSRKHIKDNYNSHKNVFKSLDVYIKSN
ncbi:MAG: hypothetical protein ACYDEC_07650 [Bacteroidia bacterium]